MTAFPDDAFILIKLLEILVMTLEALHKDTKPVRIQVSWAITLAQVFGGTLDETVQSVHLCAKDTEILRNSHKTESCSVEWQQVTSRSFLADWFGLWCYELTHHKYIVKNYAKNKDSDL